MCCCRKSGRFPDLPPTFGSPREFSGKTAAVLNNISESTSSMQERLDSADVGKMRERLRGYFRLSKNRIFKIPVCLKHKSLYLITIFKIRRKVQHEALKYCRK